MKQDSLTSQLFNAPELFQFSQAVRLLDAINYEKTRHKPQWKQFPVGYDYAQQKETVRFKVDPTLRFPDGAISKLSEPAFKADKDRLQAAQMHITFMGLTGPAGVLPMHYSETILEQNRNKDYAMRDFFDLFNHRAASLHYRGWEKYRVQYSFERTRREGKRQDPLSHVVANLSGKTHTTQHIAQDSLLYYAGLFANQTKTASGLEAILADYFAIPVQLKQFIGSWNHLQDSECTRMPGKAAPKGQFNLLGKNTIVGKRVWYSQGKFRLQLGPLSDAQFKQFLPGSTGLRKLKEITNHYIGPELSYDIQLISAAQTAPQCQLSASNAPQLGYFTWLKQKEGGKLQHDKLILA